jgi:tetrahydromethanopterin S-methyltransferase subunit B
MKSGYICTETAVKKRWPGRPNQTKSGKYLNYKYDFVVGGVKRHVIG